MIIKLQSKNIIKCLIYTMKEPSEGHKQFLVPPSYCVALFIHKAFNWKGRVLGHHISKWATLKRIKVPKVRNIPKLSQSYTNQNSFIQLKHKFFFSGLILSLVLMFRRESFFLEAYKCSLINTKGHFKYCNKKNDS